MSDSINNNDAQPAITSSPSSSSSSSSSFEEKQHQVHGYIRTGISMAVAVMSMAAYWSNRIYHNNNNNNNLDNNNNDDDLGKEEFLLLSIELGLKSLAGPALCLGGNILLVAMQRLNSPKDIDGSAAAKQQQQQQQQQTDASQASDDDAPAASIHELQSNLQNTLEQTCYAVPVYLLSSVSIWPQWRLVIPTASTLFVIGRFLFYKGIAGGVNANRGYGFALTFMPTTMLLFASLAMLFCEAMQCCYNNVFVVAAS